MFLGMLSEEAQETGNKVFKRARKGHTRTSSAISVTTDLVHWMLIESDPYLTSKRSKDTKEKEPLTEEMKALLKEDLATTEMDSRELVSQEDTDMGSE